MFPIHDGKSIPPDTWRYFGQLTQGCEKRSDLLPVHHYPDMLTREFVIFDPLAKSIAPDEITLVEVNQLSQPHLHRRADILVADDNMGTTWIRSGSDVIGRGKNQAGFGRVLRLAN
ncbi:hypothetical protein [uncultured Aliiroseovarius sp.]|uniref:hypothetical protein n=1 Tax=uncultured Aliiroseovarius sp. TaxID=1658783 RepID=UPI0026276DEF|nr:hypothetical protein [uncultured Aliiroseovarius sp.]